MLNQQRHGSTFLAKRQNAACRPRQPLRRISCGASIRQDISTAAAATAVVTAPTAADTADSSAVEAPYRVTDTTIQDIQSFHQSQINEYDYVVDASWVSGVHRRGRIGFCGGGWVTPTSTSAATDILPQTLAGGGHHPQGAGGHIPAQRPRNAGGQTHTRARSASLQAAVGLCRNSTARLR